jgi:sec-independent protein translocase protein TatA
MGGLSIWHILIIAIVLLLLFGGNRFSSMIGRRRQGPEKLQAGHGGRG